MVQRRRMLSRFPAAMMNLAELPENRAISVPLLSVKMRSPPDHLDLTLVYAIAGLRRCEALPMGGGSALETYLRRLPAAAGAGAGFAASRAAPTWRGGGS